MEDQGEGTSRQASGAGRPTRTPSTRNKYRRASGPYQSSYIGLGHPGSLTSFASAPVLLSPPAPVPDANADPAATEPIASTSGGTRYQEPSRPLQRGAACLQCRKRRAKCDGGKPVCERCLTSQQLGKDCPCIYERAGPKVCSSLHYEVEVDDAKMSFFTLLVRS